MNEQKQPVDSDRREFLQKTGYVAPVIVTLAASPAMASSGSSGSTGNDDCDGDPFCGES